MGPSEDPIRGQLVWVAEDFTRIISSLKAVELKAPTRGTRWNNHQLLFHMVLGQNIARTAIPLLGTFSWMPDGVSRAWSTMLTALTRPYDWVNWAGAVSGAFVLAPHSMDRMMSRTTSSILTWYDHASCADLARGMSIPATWDPYFTPWMSRRDILEWAPKHYRHHRAQLTLTTLEG